LRANMRSVMKNIRMSLKRVHIRFEEDYFSNGESRHWEPFSLGIVIDNIDLVTSDSEWQFKTPFELLFQRLVSNRAHR
jgi:hypothetical protein